MGREEEAEGQGRSEGKARGGAGEALLPDSRTKTIAHLDRNVK